MLKVNSMRNESMQDVTFYEPIYNFQKAGERNALAIKKMQRQENTLRLYIYIYIYTHTHTHTHTYTHFLNYLKLTC